MFERLSNPAYWKSMVLNSARAWRQAGVARPVSLLFGWEVWAMDGKAFLFHAKKPHCLRADWFEFCYAFRSWVGVRGQ